MKKAGLSFLFFSLFLFYLSAQDKQAPPSPILFIYDASGSMWGQMEGKTKMEIAAGVLSATVNGLPDGQKAGLVAYGHREKGDCEDVEFLVDLENDDKARVTQALKDIKPLGKTPLAYSARLAIDRLREAKEKATIILITDGIESCDGNICEVIKTAKEEGIDFRLHIVGFGLKAEETEQLRCAAKAGDGRYFDAAGADGLSEVLQEATSTTVDEPEANFSVYAIKNGKAIDAYIKAYKAGETTSLTSARTYGDTVFFYLPPGTYNLEVRPLEQSNVNAVTLANLQTVAGEVQHRDVSFDGGKIQVTTLNNGEGWDAVVKILAKADGKNVAGGRTYGKPDVYEVNPGLYDVEVRALVIEGLENAHRIENVEVRANEVTEVEHHFKSGTAMIGATSAAGLVDAVVKIVEVNSKKNVAGGRTYTSESSNPKKFLLTPGIYEVTLTALGVHKGKNETFAIVVKEGETLEKVVGF
ncbi:MAG: VWA domain-containing protein [Lewinellaceae bacterium]|nr:VWA domain-containing protein [Lewinellaceae bacterium]